MIQPNEIRIGNYLLTPRKQFFKVKTISLDLLHDSEDDYVVNYFNLDECSPIPLTEEILLKCGFSENLNVFCKYVEVSDEVNNNYDFVFKIIRTPDLWNNSVTKSYKYNQTHIKYLHQLQNIYFCITGEELTINL